MKDRQLFTLALDRDGKKFEKKYDPLVVHSKLREYIPDLAGAISNWNERKDYSALKVLTDGLAKAFNLVDWSEECQHGVTGEEYFEIWQQWCDWGERVKKNTQARRSSSSPTAPIRQPAKKATTS